MKKTLIKVLSNVMIAVMVMALFAGFAGFASADGMEVYPQIEARPGLSVEVGEKVLFSGETTTCTNPELLKKARFEWDFGDGYCLKYGSPTSKDSGMSAVHCFMQPGTYTVTLTVTVFEQYDSGGEGVGAPAAQGSASVQITVSGDAPMAGFELLFAPLESRLAQFITVKVPQEVASVSTNRLVVTLFGDGGYGSSVLLDKDGLSAEEKFLLEQRDLPSGNYRLVAELKNESGGVISTWVEKFSKPYSGIPAVGIDEWNAICVNGDPMFITSPYWLGSFDSYTAEFNTIYLMSSYSQYTPQGWANYINQYAVPKGWMAIGPGRGTYQDGRNARNSSLSEIRNYGYAAGGHPSMLIWDWSLYKRCPGGGVNNLVPPPVLAAWAYAAREADPAHPTMTRIISTTYLPHYDGQPSSNHYFDYRNSGVFSGKKLFFSDILNMLEVYPINNRKSTPLFNKDRGVIDLWVQSIENIKERNFNLVPIAVNLEVGQTNTQVPAITGEQVLMEAWLAAIHGAKIIDWQTFQAQTGTIQTEAMRKFTAAMATFDNIFLGPELAEQEKVTDNSNERCNRVDTLTKKDGNYTYLFAARLTEPDPLPEETNHQAYPEPDSITTTFTVPGLVNGRADVLDEAGEIVRVLPIENSQFQDVFNKCDVRIYRLSDGDPNENFPPVFYPIGDKTVKAGVELTFVVSANDPDGAEENLVFSASDLPEGASFDPATRTFRWTPQEEQGGTHSVTFTVSDGPNQVSQTIEITVIVVPLVSIEITSPPAKTSYFVGDELDLTGLVVTGTYEDNTTAVLPITMEHISGFDSSAPQTGQVVTVTYKGKSATFTVNIIYTDLVPHIEVRPGASVEVNEEVFFTAEGTTYSDESLLRTARYEWDFGDGYVLKNGDPYYYSIDDGFAAVHYFMRPGTFTVTLTVSIYAETEADGQTPTGDPIVVRSTSVDVTVTGEAPMEGFELMHAPFNARIAQFITATIPPEIAANTLNSIAARVEDQNGATVATLYEKTGLQAQEKFLLDHSSLPQGVYYLVAELKDSGGSVISRWREKFSKPYDGVPEVGINEWNAICVDGEPFFPIFGYMLDKDEFAEFEGSINALNTIGYYNEAPNHNHYPELWEDYLNAAQQEGLAGMGPGRGDFGGRGREGVALRNCSLERMKDFVNMGKDNESMLSWCWMDEPNLGGRGKQVPPPVMLAWEYATKEEDPQHPVGLNLYGYDHIPGYYWEGNYYDYVTSDQFNARHTFYQDYLTMDVYPINYRRTTKLYNKPNNGVVDLWVQTIDTFRDKNLNMIPLGYYIECCDIREENIGLGPSNEQVLMECWLAVTHGAKMIGWFNYFLTGTLKFEAMREFKTCMDTYGRIVLGPDLPESELVTDNSNVRNNRVDTLTKKDGDSTYLFAVRLTEPEPLPDETNHLINWDEEPVIQTTFTVPGIESGRAELLNEYGETVGVVPVQGGQFTDGFAHCEYKIYRISEGDPNENFPPVFEHIGDKTVTAGSTLEFEVEAVDANGDELTYSAENLPEGASFNPEIRVFAWTPQAEQVGEYNVTFVVTDGENPPVSETVKITVVPEGYQSALAFLSGPGDVDSESVFTETLALRNAADDVYAGTFTLSYDGALFELESLEAADSEIMIPAYDASVPGIVRLTVAASSPIAGDGVPLVNLRFRSKALAASQTSSIVVESAVLGTGGGSEFEAEIEALSVLINLRKSAEVSNVVAVKVGADQVEITWADPADAVFAGVKIVGENGTVIEPVLVPKGVQSATIDGLAGTTCSFRVIALNGEGRESDGVAVTVELTFSGDLNGDGSVTTGDLAMAAVRYGARQGDANWDEAQIADINGDGVVDIEDLAYIARRILNIQ